MNKDQGIELDESCFNTSNEEDNIAHRRQLDINYYQQDHREYILRQ